MSKITFKPKTDQCGRMKITRGGTATLYLLVYIEVGLSSVVVPETGTEIGVLVRVIDKSTDQETVPTLPNSKIQITKQTKGQGQCIIEGTNCNAERFNFPLLSGKKWSISTANCNRVQGTLAL